MSERISVAAGWLLVLAPGALIVALGFSAGGFFPGVVALGAIGLGLALVLRLTLAEQPFAGLSVAYVGGAAALALFALWTLISASWSDAPARAMIEYDRALLYLLAFVLFGVLARTPERLRWMLRAIAFGAVLLCVCGFVTRALPDVWSVRPTVENARLSYPLTYWNALGLLAGVALVLCFALTSDLRESRVGRVLAAAVLPVLAATLLLTFSRGAVFAVVAGLVAVIVVGRPGALLSGLLVGVPAMAVAVRAAYDADLLATADPTTKAAVVQGHELAMVVGICVLAAGAGRALLLLVDAWIVRLDLAERLLGRPCVRWGARAGVAVAAIALLVGLGAPGELQHRYDGFRGVSDVDDGDDGGGIRDRLTAVGNNGRIVHWSVALNAFRDDRLRGDGAGTYGLRWDRDRTQTFQVEDAHSLYFEVLAELGLVGMIVLGAALLLILGGLLARARGPDRMVGAGLFAAALTWALHAGVDWDWEMPAITLWVFAVGALALAAPAPASAAVSADAPELAEGAAEDAPAEDAPAQDAPPARRSMSNLLRIVAALGCLVLLVVPATILRSQGPLVESARAFSRGDCPAAIDHALDSTAALGVRPEPYVVLGYCDVRLGQPLLGVQAMENAVRVDPSNWESYYGLALVRAAAELDPRPAARTAARLNPSDSDLATAAVKLFDTDDKRAWPRRALRAALPFE